MAIATELTITSASAADMAATMFGDGIQIVSATYSGDLASSGIYSGATTTIPGITPSDAGVILSTGMASDFTAGSGTSDTNPGSSGGTDMAGGIDGDAQLNAAAGEVTFDGAIFEASFIPDGDYLTMQFVFSSEEYLEYVGQSFNDTVGVWVNGAFVPLSISVSGSVSIDSVNSTQNANLYIDNPAAADLFNTSMDGFTVTLSLKAPVIAGQTNTIKIGIADGGDGAYDSNLLISGNSIQTVALAMDDKVSLLANSSRTFDILANDRDLRDTGLTITQINGQDIVVGQTITLATGEQVRLNADGTITVSSDGDLGANVFTYTVTDGAGNTDVGYVTITTTSATGPDGIVEGTAAADVIDATYLGDPDGDRIDNNDALGMGGTTGDGDYVIAGAGADSIVAGAGNDVIFAGADNDTVFGGDGNDWVSLGTGNDSFGTFSGDSGGNDTVYGDAGNDFIITGGEDDIVYGGTGGDTVSGGVGSDTLYGGDGDDFFMVADDHDYDSVDGGVGIDTFGAGNAIGTDGIAVTFSGTGAGTYDYLGTTAAGDFSNIEVINGTNYADNLNASADMAGIVLQGEGGNDTLLGGSGADTLEGGTGADSISGGAGADTIDGGAGSDTLVGDDGNDTLQGMAGDDAVYGGTGADSLLGWDGNDTLYGGADADMVDGETGDDRLYGDAGDDTLVGDDGNDTLYGGTGNDQIYDSTGDDVVDAGDGNDQVFVGDGGDSVDGGAGADSLYGGAGSDTLTGGLDADVLDGGDDSDVFYGGGGDVVDGGEGGTDFDTLNVANVFSITYDAANGENGTITFIDNSTMVFRNIEQVVVDGVPYEPVDGTSGADFMDIGYTDAQGDQIDGADGNNDTIYGYAGGDTIYGGAGTDSILGGIGNDEIAGGTGDDTLIGEAGNDTLTAGAGNDVLYGGDDADVLVASGPDIIFGGEGGVDTDTLIANNVVGITYDPTNSENGVVTFADGTKSTFQDIETVVLNGGNLDGIVYGTAAADYIGAGYVDNNGDMIDAGDAVYAGADPDDDDVFAGDGNDTILSGAGVDNVYAGTGADLVYTGDGNDYGQGNEDNDTLYGGLGDDFLRGDAGNDSVFGGLGNDTNYGGLGQDVIDTGDGDDYAFGGYGNDTVYGGIGNDTLTGSDGNDFVYGGDGADEVLGSNGDDTLYGGDGVDTLYGDADADVIYGGVGDVVDGGEAGLIDNDTLFVNDVASIAWDAINSENGVITFNGGGTLSFVGIENLFVDGVAVARPDGTVSGTAGNDVIDLGYVGDPDGDRIDNNDASLFGQAPNDDVVLAGAGNDSVEAGLGNDTVYGGGGDDTLNGDVGNDVLYGENGVDWITGGDGNDTLYGGLEADTLFGGDGADSLSGGEGNDELLSGTGNDTLLGQGGDDTILLVPGFGTTSIVGGETGETNGDTLDLANISQNLTIDLSGANPESGTVSDGTSTATYSEIEHILLGEGVDTLVLADGSGADRVGNFEGPTNNGDGTFTGKDQINVSALHDANGDPVNVNDVVITVDGAGNAVLNFPNGESLVLEGIMPSLAASPAYLVAMGIPAAPVLDGIVSGTSGSDLIDTTYTGDPDGDRIDNNDAILPGHAANDDVVQAGSGNDTVNSGAGNDTVYGDFGQDALFGGDGADVIFGGFGFDTINTGAGADIAYGGDDTDQFIVQTGGGDDTIYGGEGGSDYDVLSATGMSSGVNISFTGNEAGTLMDGADTVSFSEIETLDLTGFNDEIDASATTWGITVNANAGDDTIVGGTGADVVFGGAGDDKFTVMNGFGNGTLTGGEASEVLGDTLDLSAIGDALMIDLGSATAGAGTISSGTQTTTYSEMENIVLGHGVDTLVLADGSGADKVESFTGPISDGLGGFVGVDLLNVAQLTDATGNPVDVADVVVTDDGNGNAVLTFPNGENLTLVGIDATLAADPAYLMAMGIPPASDGIIEGTAASDLIDASYLGDPTGDRVDAGDAILAGAVGDDDYIVAGAGNDTVRSGLGNDQVFGGDGTDNLQGEAGNDTLDGGLANDTLYGGAGDDLITGGVGNDNVDAGIGNDTVDGGDGNDFVDAAAGNDSISGGLGADTLWGGVGGDTLSGGDGADSMLGGDDRDLFFGGQGDIVDGGEGGDDVDTLNLTGFGKTLTNIIYGGGTNESGTVEFLDGVGAVIGTMAFQNIENIVPCFTPGILIETDRGEVKVEDLVIGDQVMTRDHGLQPIRWVGVRRMTRFDLIDQPKLNPIRIRAGALGLRLPERDMLVSPQHRMLMSGPRAEMFFGESEVLVAATHLVGETGIERIYPNGVTYIHVMFELHQIILADGTWTESFQPGDQTLSGMDVAMRDELFAIFPELEQAGVEYPAARPTLKAHEARVLLSR